MVALAIRVSGQSLRVGVEDLLAKWAAIQGKRHGLVSQRGKGRLEQSEGDPSADLAVVGHHRAVRKHRKHLCFAQFLSQVPARRLHRQSHQIGELQHRMAVADDEQCMPLVRRVLTESRTMFSAMY